MDFKAWTSPSDLPSQPNQEELLDQEASSEQKSTLGVEDQVEQKSTPEWKVSLTRSDLKNLLQDAHHDPTNDNRTCLSDEEVERRLKIINRFPQMMEGASCH